MTADVSSSGTAFTIRRLAIEDISLFRDLNRLFGEEFDERDTYGDAPPADDYVKELLGDDTFIALVALEGDRIVGGLAAYELKKFERERSEVYIYDLAVAQSHRRRGIATMLIEALKPIALKKGAWVVFVQADYVDEPAVALYDKLGTREQVLHFDIDIK